MTVAAHPPDLKAAQSCGLKAGYVPRPLEGGPAYHSASANSAAGPTTASTSDSFDVTAHDFIELAAKLA
jgi:hypothetical protein